MVRKLRLPKDQSETSRVHCSSEMAIHDFSPGDPLAVNKYKVVFQH